MEHTYQVIEDNGGGLHLFLFDADGTVVRGVYNLEYLSESDFADSLAAIEDGDDGKGWDSQYDNPQTAYDELTSHEFGWQLVANESKTFPDRMGRAAQLAYGIDDD